MNGASDFQEVRSFSSRSPSYRLLHKQRHQFGKCSWHLPRAHDLTALSRGISTKREIIPDTFFMLLDGQGQRKQHAIQLTRKEGNMTRWSWLAVLGISVLLTGCADIFSPCAHPGAMSVAPDSWDKTQSLGGIPGTNCLYGLDIRGIDSGSGEVKATVAEAVVDRNRNRMNEFFNRQFFSILFSTSWFTDFRKEDYPFHVFAFKVQDKKDLSHFKEGDKDITFEGVPGTHYLKFCDKTCMDNRQALIDKVYPPTNK